MSTPSTLSPRRPAAAPIQEEDAEGAIPAPALGALAEEDDAAFATPGEGLGGEDAGAALPPRRSARAPGAVAPASLPSTQQRASAPAVTPAKAPAKASKAPARKVLPPAKAAGAAKRKAGSMGAKAVRAARPRGPRRHRHNNYGRAIHALLGAVAHAGGTSMSKGAMATMNDLVCDVRDRLAAQAAELLRPAAGSKRPGKQTLGAREIQTATRFLFPGELAKHAVKEGSSAVLKAGAAGASGLV